MPETSEDTVKSHFANSASQIASRLSELTTNKSYASALSAYQRGLISDTLGLLRFAASSVSHDGQPRIRDNLCALLKEYDDKQCGSEDDIVHQSPLTVICKLIEESAAAGLTTQSLLLPGRHSSSTRR